MLRPTHDQLSDADRARLHRALDRGLAQADAGDLIDADAVLVDFARPL